MSDNVRFVQFPHPGGEHSPDAGDRKGWNLISSPHARKFLSLSGSAVSSTGLRSGELWAWAEWEPESLVVRELMQPDHQFPRYLWSPFYEPKSNYAGLHNTDPFIYGGFWYGNCKQGSSPSLMGLKELDRGSVIVFGSANPTRSSWVVDTVFVVSDFIDCDSLRWQDQIIGIPEGFRDVFILPTFANTREYASFRLYRGATYSDPVSGMFSFFPCMQPGSNHGFPRPAITLEPEYFSVGLRQGAKGHARAAVPLTLKEVRRLWSEVRAQVEAMGLELGVAAAFPPPAHS